MQSSDSLSVTTESVTERKKNLLTLLLMVMWERMAHFGIRSLLVLYVLQGVLTTPESGFHVIGHDFLSSAFPIPDAKAFASLIFALFVGATVVTSIVGGLISDLGLGRRRGIMLGMVLVASGAFLLMIPALFIFALLLIALGTGFMRPNLEVEIGSLYQLKDARRELTFLVMLFAINIGAFLTPIIFGTIGEKLGFAAAFGSIGVFMLIGFLIFLFGRTKWKAEENKIAFPKSVKISLALAFLFSVFYTGLYEDDRLYGFVGQSHAYAYALVAFLLLPVGVYVWRRSSSQDASHSSFVKLRAALVCLLVAVGTITLLPGLLANSGIEGKISFFWTIPGAMFFSLADLIFTPLYYGFVTRMAPTRWAATIVAIMGAYSAIAYRITNPVFSASTTATKASVLVILSLVGGLIGWLLYRTARKQRVDITS